MQMPAMTGIAMISFGIEENEDAMLQEAISALIMQDLRLTRLPTPKTAMNIFRNIITGLHG